MDFQAQYQQKLTTATRQLRWSNPETGWIFAGVSAPRSR